MPVVKTETLQEIVCFLWRDDPETAGRVCAMGKYFMTQAIMRRVDELKLGCKNIREILAYVRGNCWKK